MTTKVELTFTYFGLCVIVMWDKAFFNNISVWQHCVDISQFYEKICSDLRQYLGHRIQGMCKGIRTAARNQAAANLQRMCQH